MIIDNKIILKNYKCFDSTGGEMEKILPITVVIGKNNSGKSSMIDLVQFIIQKHKSFLETGRDNTKPSVLIEHKLKIEEIYSAFPDNTRGGGIPGENFFEYGKRFLDCIYTYQLEGNGKKTFVKIDAEFVPEARTPIEKLANAILFLLKNQNISRKLGENGRNFVEQHLVLARMISETEAVYETLWQNQ